MDETNSLPKDVTQCHQLLVAARKMTQQKPGQTLQATALVHQAYPRLVDVEKSQHWNRRSAPGSGWKK